MPSTPIRVALFGSGSSSTIFHLPFLLARPDRFEVVAVLDRKGLLSRESLPHARVFSTWEDLVRDPDYDLGIVTLPNALHADVACRILESGRHVVVEKPLTTTAVDAEKLLEAERRSGRRAFVYHNRRLDGDFLLIREFLATGRLGRLVHVEVRMDRWSPTLRKKAWKETGEVGSTLLEDLGSHLLDQALLLFGGPEFITCRTGVQRDASRSVDAFRISLEYPGLWVDLESSLVSRVSAFHWLLHGTGGSLIKRGVDPQEAQLTSGISPADLNFGVEAPEQAAEFFSADGGREVLTTPAGNYGDFYLDLWNSLEHGTASTFSATGGAQVVRLLDLARKSQALAQTLPIS